MKRNPGEGVNCWHYVICQHCEPVSQSDVSTPIACQFCGESPATNMRYKPSDDYGMEYDLCDKCADNHTVTWNSLGPLPAPSNAFDAS